VNAQTTADTFSDWQVAVTVKIVRYCWAKYLNLRHVVSHAKLDSQFRSDPGTKFPWEKFKNLVLSSDQQAPFASLIAATRNAEDISPGQASHFAAFRLRISDGISSLRSFPVSSLYVAIVSV